MCTICIFCKAYAGSFNQILLTSLLPLFSLYPILNTGIDIDPLEKIHWVHSADTGLLERPRADQKSLLSGLLWKQPISMYRIIHGS